jgi:hypothetical protein
MLQGLHDYAVLLRFRLQRAYLLRARVWRTHIETDSDTLESDRHFLGDAQRPLQIKVAFHCNLDALGLDAHRGGHHLAGDLGARGQSAQ